MSAARTTNLKSRQILNFLDFIRDTEHGGPLEDSFYRHSVILFSVLIFIFKCFQCPACFLPLERQELKDNIHTKRWKHFIYLFYVSFQF
jgi:hypothetical protein